MPETTMDKADLLEAHANTVTIKDILFDDLNWNEMDLMGAVFSHCTFIKAHFIDVILEDARFENCTFKKCRFPRTNLQSAEFTDCIFFDSESGTGATFSHANMQDVCFQRCNLSTSIFQAANLFDARFEDCMAQGCNFESATFSRSISSNKKYAATNVSMNGSNFDYAVLHKLSLSSCTLTDCSFRESDMRDCDFTDADMTSSDLAGAETRHAHFEGTDLRGANLSGMILGNLKSFHKMKINADQQTDLLTGLGIQVL